MNTINAEEILIPLIKCRCRSFSRIFPAQTQSPIQTPGIFPGTLHCFRQFLGTPGEANESAPVRCVVALAMPTRRYTHHERRLQHIITNRRKLVGLLLPVPVTDFQLLVFLDNITRERDNRRRVRRHGHFR